MSDVMRMTKRVIWILVISMISSLLIIAYYSSLRMDKMSEHCNRCDKPDCIPTQSEFCERTYLNYFSEDIPIAMGYFLAIAGIALSLNFIKYKLYP